MPRTVQLASKPSVGEGLVPDDHVVVLFGGTGDLARRKLLPGLFRLAQAGLRRSATGSSPPRAAR